MIYALPHNTDKNIYYFIEINYTDFVLSSKYNSNSKILGFVKFELNDICLVKDIYFNDQVSMKKRIICLQTLQKKLNNVIITPIDIYIHKELWIEFFSTHTSKL